MAEVKVKITAQNEVQTGLQQALTDAKKFGQEATSAVTIDEQAATAPIRKIQSALAEGVKVPSPTLENDRPLKVPVEAAVPKLSDQQAVEITAENEKALAPLREIQAKLREIRERSGQPVPTPEIDASPVEELATKSASAAGAIRGLATDIANASSPAQVFEAVIKRAASAFGGLVAATAGFAIGSVIRNTLEEAAAGLNDLIDRSQALQQSFGSLSAPTTTFDQLASKIRSASSEIEALEEANRKLQSGIGFQLADYVSSFDLSTAADRETDSATSNVRGSLANAIAEATRRELQLAEARTEEERKLIALQANREQLLAAARESGPEVEQRTIELFAAQDLRAVQQIENSLDAQADKQRAINEDNKRSLEERLTREKQGLADLEQFSGGGIDLQRQQAIARIAALEDQIAAKRQAAEAQIAAVRTQAQQVRDANADALRSPEEKLAREQQALADLDGFAGPAVDLAREQTIARIRALEAEITSERERQEQATQNAAKSLEGAIEQREFAGLSSEEQQAKIGADQADLIAGIESGEISPAEAAQRALELANRQESLDGGGSTGSFGASSLQRIGFASNEFFDTRKAKDPATAIEKGNKLLQQIKEALSKGEPLVLNPTSS